MRSAQALIDAAGERWKPFSDEEIEEVLKGGGPSAPKNNSTFMRLLARLEEVVKQRNNLHSLYARLNESHVAAHKAAEQERGVGDVGRRFPWTWCCEFCYIVVLEGNLPKDWDLVWQSAVCPNCQNRVEADGGYAVVKGGAYSDGRTDPRSMPKLTPPPAPGLVEVVAVNEKLKHGITVMGDENDMLRQFYEGVETENARMVEAVRAVLKIHFDCSLFKEGVVPCNVVGRLPGKCGCCFCNLRQALTAAPREVDEEGLAAFMVTCSYDDPDNETAKLTASDLITEYHIYPRTVTEKPGRENDARRNINRNSKT